MQALKGTTEEKVHLSALRKSIFVTEIPSYTIDGQNGDSFAMPVLSNGDSAMRLHPTTKPSGKERPAVIAQAEKALEWLRSLLTETALSVTLAPFQVLIMPNRKGKHAVGKKVVDESGLTDRQFIRVYGRRGYKPTGNNRILVQPK